MDYFFIRILFQKLSVRKLLMFSALTLPAVFLNPKEIKYLLEIFANEIINSIKKSKFT